MKEILERMHAVYAARAAEVCPRRQLSGEAGMAQAAAAAEAVAARTEEAAAVAADWALARRHVDYVGDQAGAPSLETERQREFARRLVERDAREFEGWRRRSRGMEK